MLLKMSSVKWRPFCPDNIFELAAQTNQSNGHNKTTRQGWHLHDIFLANRQRNKQVIITSKRQFDVSITCLLRCVFVGLAHWWRDKMVPSCRWSSLNEKRLNFISLKKKSSVTRQRHTEPAIWLEFTYFVTVGRWARSPPSLWHCSSASCHHTRISGKGR